MSDQKIWRSNEHGIKVVCLTDDRLDEALRVMRESYYTDEPVALATRLQTCPEAIDELEQLTLDTYKDGVSLVALKNDQVVGVSFNKLQTKTGPGEKGFFDIFMETKCNTETAREYMNLMIKVDSRKDIYDHYEVTSSMEVMFLVTSRTARKQGVGTLLVAASEDIARSKGIPLCTAICSSVGTQRICSSLNWDQLATALMSEFEFKGEPYSKFTGDNQSLILVGHRT